jgi:hypothetical protein
MKIHHTTAVFSSLLLSGSSLTLIAWEPIARADVVLRAEAPQPPNESISVYPVEIEPHLALGPGNVYGASGYGAGVRFGVPVAFGHLGSVPQNLAVGLGLDLLHYDNCYFGTNCGANYLLVPAAAQWNVFVTQPVNVFAEGGVYLYKGWFTGCGPGDGPGCAPPSDFGLLPTFALGGRFRMAPSAALTLRIGYPTTTLGVSFM